MPYFEDYGSDFHFDYWSNALSVNLPGMHIHPQYEILVTTLPTEQIPQINGVFYPSVSQPALTVFAPFSMHLIWFPEGQRSDRYVYYIGNQTLDEFSSFFKLHKQSFDNILIRYPLSPSLLERIMPMLENTRKSRNDKILCKLNIMLIVQMVTSEVKPDLVIKTSKDMGKISKIIEYMVEHRKENLTAEAVAEHFFISRSKLNQDFRAHVKIGFHELFMEIKLNQACYMLESGKQSIREIAQSLGFEQENYFNTFFKRMMGMTPLQYRKTTHIERLENVKKQNK